MLVIGLVGKKRSGKDTFGEFLQVNSHQECILSSFALPLKDEVRDFLKYLNILPNYISSNFDEEHREGLRELWQVFGSELRRGEVDQQLPYHEQVCYVFTKIRRSVEVFLRKYFPELEISSFEEKIEKFVLVEYPKATNRYWIDRAEEQAFKFSKASNGLLVYRDCRFPNEEQFIKSLNGICIRIVRPDNNDDADIHISETLQDQIETQYIITNDGTLEDLEIKAKELLAKIS